MKSDTHHMSTDLDIVAPHDLTPLADALAHRGLLVGDVHQWDNVSCTARFTTEKWFEEAD